MERGSLERTDFMADSARDTLSIDIVSDVVCPWCYIGKRRLEAALALLRDDEPDVRPAMRWHPFELNPDLPHEGIDRRSYLERKFGSVERTRGIYERVRAAGLAAGIAFALDSIVRQPNTRDAHRLIDWAQRQGDADALVEQLFRGFFLEGRSIGDCDELVAMAGEAGLDATAARALLASDDGVARVAAMERRALAMGVEGVPFFIFDGRIAVSGAQEPDVLRDAIVEAIRTPDPRAPRAALPQ